MSKTYRKRDYQRRKEGISERIISNEETCACTVIRDKWDLPDKIIRKLLQDFTMTQIVEGEFEGNRFIPGPRLSEKFPLIVVFILLVICGITQLSASPEPEITFTPNDHIIGDNVSK